MKRIFYLITELDVGGAEKALYELASRLDRKQFELVVVCLQGRGVIADWLEEKGIEVIQVGMKGWWDLPALLRLRNELLRQKPHALHSFLFHANLAGRVASIGLKMLKIASIRVEEPRRSHLLIERLTQRLTDKFTCVSNSARFYTHKRAHIPLEKIEVVANGIDPACCDFPVMAPPAEWSIPSNAPVVAFIGRLEPQKNPLLLIESIPTILGAVPETLFVFAGKGSLEAACKREAERLKVSSHIRWLGWIPDLRPLLTRMDLLALPSTWEGMPNVVLEAMACRKPTVATNTGGCAELIEDGKTGFLVPPSDPGALAERIIRLLEDPGLRAKLGLAAYSKALREYSIAAMVKQNENLYLASEPAKV